jgi:hypothetical protein
MCPTPPPISEFGRKIMELIVNGQLDLVKKEIKRFKKKGYDVYYRKISEKEYESSNFIENAGKMMKEAKDNSKGRQYNGILVFYPFINKKNYKRLFMQKSFIFSKYFDILWRWSIKFNKGSCLSKVIFNQTDAVCEDTNIYFMAFYFKGGLNWK